MAGSDPLRPLRGWIDFPESSRLTLAIIGRRSAAKPAVVGPV